jgi:hypothetical protein
MSRGDVMGFSSELAVLLTAEPEDEWLDNYEPPSDGTCACCEERVCLRATSPDDCVGVYQLTTAIALARVAGVDLDAFSIAEIGERPERLSIAGGSVLLQRLEALAYRRDAA